MKVNKLKDIVNTIEDKKNICCNFFVLRLVYNIESYMFISISDFKGRIERTYTTEHKVKELLR